MYDVCANLTNNAFKRRHDAIVTRAAAAGVTRFVVTGGSANSSRTALKLAERFPHVMRTTVGVHPEHASTITDADACIAELDAVCQQGGNVVVAIGECGLDYSVGISTDPVEHTNQANLFDAQLNLAVRRRLPVFLHERDAHDDFVRILTPYMSRLPAAVVHCFTGDRSRIKTYLDMGCYIGITGWVNDTRADELRDAVKVLPLDRVLVETDCPYMLPSADMSAEILASVHKVRTNEPCFLPFVVQRLAQCMGVDGATLQTALQINTRRVFGDFFASE